jgi:hypothetical protein
VGRENYLPVTPEASVSGSRHDVVKLSKRP